MKRWKDFFKNIGYGLNPWKYERIAERFVKDAFVHFFLFLAFAFIVGLVISIPALLALPANLESQLDGFDTLVVEINSTTSSPVAFPARNPLVTIDTESNESSDSFISITGDAIHVGGGVFVLEEYKNLLLKKATVSRVVTAMFLLTPPSLIVILFLYFAAKYILIISIASVLGLVAAKALRFTIRFRDIFKTGMAASTPMILIDMIRIPLDMQLYALSYVLFGLFFIFGVVKVGSFAPGGQSGRRGRGLEYVEVKNKVF